MNENLETRVRQIAADVFNQPLDKISHETSPQTLTNWDSVQHLNFILALESSLGVTLDPEDVDEMLNIGSAIAVVRDKLAK